MEKLQKMIDEPKMCDNCGDLACYGKSRCIVYCKDCVESA
jgi:hypothetical protein